MKKTKILSVLLCAALAFSLTACSNSSGGGSDDKEPETKPAVPSGNDGDSGNNGGGITPKLPTAITAGENGTAGTTGTYVYFGEWPQTLLEDNSIIESVTKTVGMFTYYKGGNDWYAKIEANSDNSSDTYYKVEPIKWRVLNPAATGSEKKMLLAENILINCAYYDFNGINRTIGNATVYPNNYEHSRVRAFLNGLSYQKKESDSTEQTSETEFEGKGFLQTAFTAEEIAAIADTSVVNNARSTNPDANENQFNHGINSYASNTPTSDKIFLLSEQEVTKSAYGFEAYNAHDDRGKALGERNTRIREATAFAKTKGAWQSSTDGFGGYWWLRSPLYNGTRFANIAGSYGLADSLENVSYGGVGVVPALCLIQK